MYVFYVEIGLVWVGLTQDEVDRASRDPGEWHPDENVWMPTWNCDEDLWEGRGRQLRKAALLKVIRADKDAIILSDRYYEDFDHYDWYLNTMEPGHMYEDRTVYEPNLELNPEYVPNKLPEVPNEAPPF